MAAAGVNQAIYTLARTPSFASFNPTDTTCSYYVAGGTGASAGGQCDPPSDVATNGTGADAFWKTWVTAIAQHVTNASYIAGTGAYAGTPHTPIRYWEIWNEPDTSSYWNGTYAQLVRMTEDARCIITGTGEIHNAGPNGVGDTVPCTATAIDPTAQIVMPSYHAKSPSLGLAQDFLYCSESTHKTTCNTGSGGANAVDIINFHMKPGEEYPTTLESTLSTWVGNIRGILQTNESQKPLYNDEGGYGEEGWASPYTDSNMQASFLARDYLYSAWLNVADTVWYYQGGGTGMGSATANTAYTEVYRWMTGSTFESCSVSGTVWTCTMTLSNGVAAEAMWDTSQTCTPCTTGNVAVSNAWISYLDLTGTSHTIVGDTVPVGIQPVLLEQ
jgi:hypothetical protein